MNMTLDDFFTLTEMNNGLTVPSRVEELVSVMQKEIDDIAKNAGDASRPWSAVAKAISATTNKDCLNLFIQLNGLQYIAKWLEDAKNSSNESTDTLSEESISLSLQALEKLNLDHEKVIVSEIWTTVEDLISHNSSKVQDKARVLIESWKGKGGSDSSILEVDDNKLGNGADTERDGRHSMGDASLSKEISDEETGHNSTKTDPVVSLRANTAQTAQVENERYSVKNDKSLDHIGSPSLKKPVVEPTSLESGSPAASKQDTLDGETEFHELESTSDIKEGLKTESLQVQLCSLGEVNMSEEKLFTSGSDAADAVKLATEPNSQIISFVEDKIVDIRNIDSNEKGALDDSGSADQPRSSNAGTDKEGGEISQNCENAEKLGTLLPGSVNDGNINNVEQHVHDDEMKNDHNISKKETRKKSDVELEYGIVDPLEVARKVAKEVDGDNREQSCSSSEKLPEGRLCTPESKSHTHEGPANDVEEEPDLSPLQDDSMTSFENPEAEQTIEIQEMETSEVTETAQGKEANAEKSPCNFDLNDEICSDDHTDHSANENPTPVSIVSASRAAAAPGLPMSPLQFEGELGWKGSAATSAFRPASPRRVPVTDKDLTVGKSNLNFDLNVAENVGPSESSIETSSKQSERLELDLNLMSEDGGPPSDWQMAQFFPRSSSLSPKQSSSRNFNLNDQPSFLNDPSDNSCLSNMPQIFNGVKSDESVISIMGRRVEVNRKEIPPTIPWSNGQTPELGFDVNLVRPVNFLGIGSMIPYSHAPVYGYDNVAPGPVMPFSSTMYGSGGPIPYMVDSRGAPVIPQIVGGPTSAMPSAFPQQPFFINMTAPNGVGPVGPTGPSRSSFDLNSGMMVGNGSRDPSGFSQFLNSGQLRSVDEQLRLNSQPSISSVVGGKRKEPENGWENHPFKQYTPPSWK